MLVASFVRPSFVVVLCDSARGNSIIGRCIHRQSPVPPVNPLCIHATLTLRLNTETNIEICVQTAKTQRVDGVGFG